MNQNPWPVVAFAFALSASGAAVAQEKLNKADKNWVEKEVGPIITAQEKATFEEIHKDDRKLFKELFWLRRDFNPGTSENEFQKDYMERVKAADEQFRGGGGKGSESDMGKIFLLLGGPNQRQQGGRPSGADPGPSPSPDPGEEPGTSPGVGPVGGESDSQVETWIYDPNPSLGIPDGLKVQFRQTGGFGFRLVSNDELTKALERVKERLVANPAVNYARDENGRLRKADAKFDPNSPAKLALKALQETGQTSDAVAFTTSPAFFRASAGQIYIPLDIVIASGLTAEKATVFGAVDNAEDVTIYQFEEQAALQKDSSGSWVWEMPLQLQPGSYSLNIGVMDETGSVVGTQIMSLEVPDLSAGDLKISSVLLFEEGNKVEETMGAPGKAFLLGGYHFAPKRELVYSHSDQLSGVFYAYNYGLAEGKPNLTVHLTFSKDGVARGATKEEPFMLQTGEMALTIFDIPLNIPNFQEPGNYKVTVKVTDHVNQKTLTQDIDFQVQGP